MDQLYFATIYYKTYASDDVIDFLPVSSFFGFYHEKEKMFETWDGKLYPFLCDSHFLHSKKRYGCGNIISLNEWKSYFEDQEMEFLLKKFHQTFFKVFYLFLLKENMMIRYHEYMLLVGVNHLLGLAEMMEKFYFKKNLKSKIAKMVLSE